MQWWNVGSKAGVTGAWVTRRVVWEEEPQPRASWMSLLILSETGWSHPWRKIQVSVHGGCSGAGKESEEKVLERPRERFYRTMVECFPTKKGSEVLRRVRANWSQQSEQQTHGSEGSLRRDWMLPLTSSVALNNFFTLTQTLVFWDRDE